MSAWGMNVTDIISGRQMEVLRRKGFGIANAKCLNITGGKKQDFAPDAERDVLNMDCYAIAVM